MIRPIETNMSLFTADHMAHHAKNDPNAHTTLAMQQAEAVKKAQDQLKTVHKSPESEGEVKIRDGNSEKNKRDQKKRRQGNDAEAEAGGEDSAKDGGRFDFLA